MKCKRCGNTVLPNQVFCNKCGAPVVEEDKKKFSLFDDDYEEDKKKNPHFIIIISIIVAIIIILLIILLIINGRNKSKNNNTDINQQTNTYMVVYENYNFTIPGDYSQGNYENRLNIYNENDDFMGAFTVKNTSFSKAVANKIQVIESKIKNTADYKYSIINQEQKNINGVNCYAYKVKATTTENGQTVTGYFYVGIAEIDENNIAYISSYITEDENTTYSYFEKLISIVKTAELRAVNTSTNTTTNTVTNSTVQNTTKTVNTSNSVVGNTR